MNLSRILKLSSLYYAIANYKLQMLPQTPTSIDSEVCAKCGGKCCNTLPGMTLPSQWGDDSPEIMSAIKNAIESGDFVFDVYETFEPTFQKIYYVRPAVVGSSSIIDTSYQGKCTMLTPTGCKLDHEHRPFECQTLEPSPSGAEGGCKSSFDRINMIKEWEPYQPMIKFMLRRMGR